MELLDTAQHTLTNMRECYQVQGASQRSCAASLSSNLLHSSAPFCEAQLSAQAEDGKAS